MSKNWKYYNHDYLTNFLLIFMSLSTVRVFKNSHILPKIYFIIPERFLGWTWKSFNTKFGPQWRNRKITYQVKQNVALFFLSSNFWLKLCWKPQKYQNYQINQVLKALGITRSKRTDFRDNHLENFWENPYSVLCKINSLFSGFVDLIDEMSFMEED